VADVAREARVPLETFDELAHHGVERFGELLDFFVGSRDDQTGRELALGNQGRGLGDLHERTNGPTGHPKSTRDANERRQQCPDTHQLQ